MCQNQLAHSRERVYVIFSIILSFLSRLSVSTDGRLSFTEAPLFYKYISRQKAAEVITAPRIFTALESSPRTVK